jgi:radical SAM superfamily enzyme YgiQ (UPF0313 family)
MRILLVNPPRFNGIPVGREDRCENTIPNVITPHGLVYLATTLMERHHEVRLLDANGYNFSFRRVEEEIAYYKPELLVFKNTPETFYSDLRTSHIAKRVHENITVVMICYSLRTVPREVMNKAECVDIYVRDFDYEKPISEVASGRDEYDIEGIAHRDGNEIILNPPTKERYDFSTLRNPAWGLLPDLSVYWVQVPSIRPCVFVESMKGCGLGCAFCTIAHAKPVFRDAGNVVDEIECLKARGVRYVNFFDATFNISSERLYAICGEIIKRNLQIKWFANVRADIKEDEARMMKKAGCDGVSIGIESGSQRILNNINKRITVSQAEEAIEQLKTAGIKQHASFIVGLPGETKDTIKETEKFIKKAKPTGFQVNSLVPYPGSDLYNVALEQGKMNELRFDDLLLYDTPVSLCSLSVDEINRYRRNMYRNVYLSPGWWFSGIRQVVRNPQDMGAGIDYSAKVLRRLLRGVEKEV